MGYLDGGDALMKRKCQWLHPYWIVDESTNGHFVEMGCWSGELRAFIHWYTSGSFDWVVLYNGKIEPRTKRWSLIAPALPDGSPTDVAQLDRCSMALSHRRWRRDIIVLLSWKHSMVTVFVKQCMDEAPSSIRTLMSLIAAPNILFDQCLNIALYLNQELMKWDAASPSILSIQFMNKGPIFNK